MKNSMLIFIIVLVVGVLGIGLYLSMRENTQTDSAIQSNDSMVKEDTSVMPTVVMVPEDDVMQDSEEMMDENVISPRYVNYNKTAFESASDTRRVLFFYASWCPTCKPADASFTQNVNDIPDDVTVIRVNYNDPETDQEEKDLAKKYGITYQHTFVQIDSDGNEVTKWNGGQIEELLSKIN